MEEGLKLPSDERYREIRRWYARDRGRTTLEEIVTLLESAAGAPVIPSGVPALDGGGLSATPPVRQRKDMSSGDPA